MLLASPGMTGGQSWESNGSSPGQPIQFRVIERSTIEVPAGSFETVRIQMNTGNNSRGVRRTLWFAENVGIVQEETIHYDEHRITVRESITLTGWTLPAAEEKSPPPPPEEDGSLPEVLPPPPDEELLEEAPPEPVAGEDSPIVAPEEGIEDAAPGETPEEEDPGAED